MDKVFYELHFCHRQDVVINYEKVIGRGKFLKGYKYSPSCFLNE